MKTAIAVLGMWALCGFAGAQEVVRPLQAWTPPGWKSIQQDTGDLDRDGVDDVVIVLEQDDPANIKANDGLVSPQLNTSPRALLVLFADHGGYRKVVENRTLVPTEGSSEEPCLDDPLAEVAIGNGTLKLVFERSLSCGGWATSKVAYTFRHDGKGMRLIGRDISTFMRNSGEETMDSINYLTGRRKLINGMYVAGEDGLERDLTPRWQRLPKSEPRYLEGIAAPEFE